MSFDISDSRTPPSVMFSTSPSYDLETNYPSNPLVSLSTERFKDVSNLKVNQRRSRSFTPVKGALYLRSPELSPIGMSNNLQLTPDLNTTNNSEVDSLTPGQFKVPLLLVKTNRNVTPTGPPTTRHQKDKENIKPTLQYAEDPNQTHSLDKSASHGYLNHNLDVRLILKNASMHQYIKAFNKEKINFEKFLTLCEGDLLRLGIKRKVDRKIISNIINDLNGN